MQEKVWEPDVECIYEKTTGLTGAIEISVCVSLFNYERFVVECLDSIKYQDDACIDLIVVDDCSNRDKSVGATLKWMRANYARFSRVMLLSHKRNQGLAAARNTAIGRAMYESVFVIDADNQIYPRTLVRLHQALVDSSSAAAYSQLEFFGDVRRLGYADVWNPESFRYGNYIDAMALIRKSAWKLVGGYSHLEGGWEDYDFWCKFVECELEGIYVPEILCRYRVHGTSMLRTETKSRNNELIVEMVLRHPWLELRVAD